MASNYPMKLPPETKSRWKLQSQLDGFLTLAGWIKWLAETRCSSQRQDDSSSTDTSTDTK